MWPHSAHVITLGWKTVGQPRLLALSLELPLTEHWGPGWDDGLHCGHRLRRPCAAWGAPRTLLASCAPQAISQVLKLGSRWAHPRPPPSPLLLVNSSVSSFAAEPWGGQVVVACLGDSRAGLSHMGFTEP